MAMSCGKFIEVSIGSRNSVSDAAARAKFSRSRIQARLQFRFGV